MINLHESMGPGRDRTHDPCSQTRICSQTRYRLRYAARLLKMDIFSLENSVDPDQLASKKPADLDPHCFPCSLRILYNLAEKQISMWHIFFFSAGPGYTAVFFAASESFAIWHISFFSRTRLCSCNS